MPGVTTPPASSMLWYPGKGSTSERRVGASDSEGVMGADRSRLRRPAAAAFAVAGLAALWWVLSPAGSAPDVVATRPADAFIESVGVNTHVTYSDTSYARHAAIAARLRELGMRHVRDG